MDSTSGKPDCSSASNSCEKSCTGNFCAPRDNVIGAWLTESTERPRESIWRCTSASLADSITSSESAMSASRIFTLKRAMICPGNRHQLDDVFRFTGPTGLTVLAE